MLFTFVPAHPGGRTFLTAKREKIETRKIYEAGISVALDAKASSRIGEGLRVPVWHAFNNVARNYDRLQ